MSSNTPPTEPKAEPVRWPVDPTNEPAPTLDSDAPDPGAPVEIGGRAGPDPTRYGDWEKGGRCIDF